MTWPSVSVSREYGDRIADRQANPAGPAPIIQTSNVPVIVIGAVVAVALALAVILLLSLEGFCEGFYLVTELVCETAKKEAKM